LDSGGRALCRRTAIHSAKEVENEGGWQQTMDIILVGRKSVKKGVFQFIKAQKSGEEEKAKGGQRAGVYDGWQESRGQEEALQVTKSGLL